MLLVRPDEVFGFLGPNGAAKTCTLRMAMAIGLWSTEASSDHSTVDVGGGGVGVMDLWGFAIYSNRRHVERGGSAGVSPFCRCAVR